LGVTALRAGRAAAAGIGAIGCVVYVIYFFEMSYTRASVFSDEPAALALAWLPNILLILASAAFLSARHEARLPDQVSAE
jgi:lipopolysaccharide export LptBFGC system permease protein LptF